MERIERARFSDLRPGSIVRVYDSWGVITKFRKVDFWHGGVQPRPDQLVAVIRKK